MATEPKEMKSIWYFVGLMLMTMGAVIAATGLYQLFEPPATHTMFMELHPNLWWGLFMVLVGAIFYFGSKKWGK